MTRNALFLAGVLAATSLLGLVTVGDPAAAVASTGTEFFAVELRNFADYNDFGIAVVNREAAPASVQVFRAGIPPGTEVLVASATVPPLGDQMFLFNGPQLSGSAVTNVATYRVASDRQIQAFQFNTNDPGVWTNDASLLVPTALLGGVYDVIAGPVVGLSSPTYFSVVAPRDGTVVAVTPSVNTAGGAIAPMLAGTTHVFVLNRYDVLNVESAGSGDLTGSRVVALQPVAVLAGVVCTTVILPGPCDMLNEQIWPSSEWDDEYALCRGVQLGGSVEVVRVLGIEPGATSVTVTPGPTFTVTEGAYVDVTIAGDVFLSATKRVAVAEYFVGSAPYGNVGDPAFTQVTPVSRHAPALTVYSSGAFAQNHVSIARPAGASVSLDGATVGGWSAIGASGYECARVPAGAGAHTIAGTQPISVMAHGYDQWSSYAYPASDGCEPSLLGIELLCDIVLPDPDPCINIQGCCFNGVAPPQCDPDPCELFSFGCPDPDPCELTPHACVDPDPCNPFAEFCVEPCPPGLKVCLDVEGAASPGPSPASERAGRLGPRNTEV